MITTYQVWDYLNSIAPHTDAEFYDNVGLLTGSETAEVTGVCCCLDITHDVIGEAEEKGANLIVSHHPVIFEGLKQIPEWNPVAVLVRKKIAAIAVHTNFDKADGGVNDTLCKLLDFECSGTGDLRLLYDYSYGKYCDVVVPFSPETLAKHVKNKLKLDMVRFSRGDRVIKRIAVLCGGGVSNVIMQDALKIGIDAVISGDIKHNYWIEAKNRGITLIDAGHYGTERHASARLAELISGKFPDLKVFAAECEQDPCGYV